MGDSNKCDQMQDMAKTVPEAAYGGYASVLFFTLLAFLQKCCCLWDQGMCGADQRVSLLGCIVLFVGDHWPVR